MSWEDKIILDEKGCCFSGVNDVDGKRVTFVMDARTFKNIMDVSDYHKKFYYKGYVFFYDKNKTMFKEIIKTNRFELMDI